MRKRRLACLTLLVISVLVLPYVYSRLASSQRRVLIRSTKDSPAVSASTDHLRIACYNIAHGRGTAESNWAGGSRQERRKRLDEIANLIKRLDADIVVLNEVDFVCSWSHGVNQAAYLAQRAGYPHWVEQRNCDFRVLWWTWKFGNAVLSKHPIQTAKSIGLPAYSTLESILAGQKNGLVCEVQLPNQRPIDLFAVHLSHRSESIRVASIDQLIKLMQRSKHAVVAAGDFNSTPTGFPHSATDMNGDNAIDQLERFDKLKRIPNRPPQSPEGFTFHSADPIRVIDWIFVPRDWSVSDYRVPASTLSDHRPVVVEVQQP